MRISVGYSLQLVYLFILYCWDFKQSKPVKIALRLLPKAIFLLLLMLVIMPAISYAASASWTGGDPVNAQWSDADNWDAAPVPGTGDTATFDAAAGAGGATIDLGLAVTVDTIVFDNTGGTISAYTIGAGAVGTDTLTLDSDGAITMNANVDEDQLFNADLVLGTDATASDIVFTNSSLTDELQFAGDIEGGTGGVAAAQTLTLTGAGDILVSGSISDGGADSVALTKSGAGTLTLSGVNTYGGGTTLTSGTIILGDDDALGTGDLTLAGDGTIQSDDDARSVANDIDLDTNALTVSGASNLTLSGIISDDGADGGSLVVNMTTGADTLTLSGVNTYGGATTITNGTLILDATGTIEDSEGVANAGTFVIEGDKTIGYLTGAGATTLGANTLTITDTGAYSGIASGTGGIIMDGAGKTLTLSGDNEYSGGTTVTDGIVSATTSAQALGTGAVTVADGAALQVTGALDFDEALTLSGTGVAAGGALRNISGNTDWSGVITLAADSRINSDADTLTLSGATIDEAFDLTIGGAGDTTISSIIATGANTLTKDGAGTLTLSGENTYTGSTTISAGTLQVGDGGTTGNLGTGSAINNAALVFNRSNDLTLANVISGTGTFTKNGAGILTLTGGNTYSGLTTINAGTLSLSGVGTIKGAINVAAAGAILDIGENSHSITGTYIMAEDSRLNLSIVDLLTYGSITATGNATIPGSVLMDLDITSGVYIPNATLFTAIDGAGGAGVIGGNTVTDNSPYVSFTTTGGEDLVLVASRTGTGFDSWAKTENSRAAGRALEDAGATATGDMLTVLNAMESLSADEIEPALSQMYPQIDGGIIAASNAALNQNVQTIANHLKYKRTGGSAGVGTGDEYETTNDVWIKGFGTYVSQNNRKQVEGYRAYVAGTSVGADLLATGNKTAGFGIGYSHNKIDSRKSNKAKTISDSLQLSAYYGYDNELNYVPQDLVYFDLVGSFAWNAYDAERAISFSSINRTAKSNYDGQQYSIYAEAGYHAPINNTTDWIPFLSLQYTRLNIGDYTEKDANALSLKIDSQAYNTLELGLGMKLSSRLRTETFDFVRELRFRWLYDLIADEMQTTSRFTGGGSAFTTKGAKPSRHTFDIGGSLGFITNKNLTIDFDYDYSLREDYRSHDGSAIIKFGVLLP
jgi:fibronectin-binding autotransporter adhesin